MREIFDFQINFDYVNDNHVCFCNIIKTFPRLI